MTIKRVETPLIIAAIILAVLATAVSFHYGYVTAYGDAESHLNIAKRVIDSLTPGFAQLGGIWLPLPHLLMMPLVKFDLLWRTGLSGSIVSGLAYVIATVFLYKLALLLTRNRWASLLAAGVFMTNPNILYLQSTPMTELVLIAFFFLSSFYFVRFLQDDRDLLALILAAFFGFCASLSRYDGWLLVLAEAGILVALYLPWRGRATWQKLQGRLILFATLAFFGIGMWLIWGQLILGDPLYFTHSVFSANSQQQNWLAQGQLPAYHNPGEALTYYSVTSAANIGLWLSLTAILGLILMVWRPRLYKHSLFILVLLLVPFIFNVVTLFLGQSVIFIPQLTPPSFTWNLFNVRYGVMMVPAAALGIGFLFYKLPRIMKPALLGLILLQLGWFASGKQPIITLEDGRRGLSSQIAKLPNAQGWFAQNYDQGLVLLDDYARTMSIIRTNVPMKDVIYVGNKPYWGDSLTEPEKYATWIIMQQGDDVWTNIYDQPQVQGRLFKYFQKVYTSPEILIFKRNPAVTASN